MSDRRGSETAGSWRDKLERAKRVLDKLSRSEGGPADPVKVMDERAIRLAREPERPATDDGELEVLEFNLDHERYAVESLAVREVCSIERYTPLPGAPDFVLGLINVRGEILSLLDVRGFFGLPPRSAALPQPAIVLEGEPISFAILVDQLLGVRRMDVGSFTTSAGMGPASGSRFVAGVSAERLALLDADKLLSDPAMIVDRSPAGPRIGLRP